MSVKNYIISNSKSDFNFDKTAAIRLRVRRQSAMVNITVTPGDKPPLARRILKLYKQISVEPLIICWLLPSCFLYIALENLALEKVISMNVQQKLKVLKNNFVSVMSRQLRFLGNNL